MNSLTECLFSLFVAYQATQQYSCGTGGPALYHPQQPVTVPASASYPNPAFNTTPPYLPSARAHSMPSPTSLNPVSSFPLPPSGTSFQHGRPGPPATSVAYALPTGPTGTLPATSDLPASQRTGLRLDVEGAGWGSGDVCFVTHSVKCAPFPCECSVQSLLVLRDQFKAFLKHIIFPVHMAMIQLCCCSECLLSSVSSCLSFVSQTLLQTQSFCLAQDRVLQHCLVTSLSNTVDGWWHSFNLVRLVSKPAMWLEKNEHVFLITAEKMIPILPTEQFCKCNLSLCPWFQSGISSPGLAAYSNNVSRGSLHYFFLNHLV